MALRRRPPADPMTRELIRAARSSNLTRRSLLGTADARWRRRRPRGVRTAPAARRRGGGAEAAHRPVRHPEDRPLGELDGLPRLRRGDQEVPDARAVHQGNRHRCHVQRGHRGQRLLLQQGRPAAARRAGHRSRHLRVHRLDGQPGDPRAAVPAPRPDPDAEREQPARQPQGRQLRPGPAELADLAVRLRRHRLRQDEGHQGAQDHRRPVDRRAQGPHRRAQRVPRHRRRRDAEPGRRHLRARVGRRRVREGRRRDREADVGGLHPPDQGQLLPRGPQVGQRHRGHRVER